MYQKEFLLNYIKITLMLSQPKCYLVGSSAKNP
jgi:hypothetical protein